MRTPSVRGRLVRWGGVLAVLALAAGDVGVLFALRAAVGDEVDRALDAGVAEVRRLEAAGTGADDLTAGLAARGVAATVTTPGGPALTTGPRRALGRTPVATRRVALGTGSEVEVAASSAPLDRATSRATGALAAVNLAVGLLALLGLRRLGRSAEAGLGEIEAAATRTAAGQFGRRLRPDRPGTALGRLASAYDGMLDVLEQGVVDGRKARAAIERIEQRQRQIVDTAQEAFVSMDRSGVIVDWNVEAERLFGWAREEVLGRSLADTLLPPERRQTHRDQIRRFEATGRADFLEGRLQRELLHRDGHRIPVWAVVWATRQQGEVVFSGFIRDRSEQLAARDEIARLAAVVESTDESIISTDLEGRILTWNRGAESMYGFRASEAIGRHLSIIVPDEARAQVERSLALLRRSGGRAGRPAQRLETVRRRKDGRVIDVALTISPVVNGAGVVTGGSSVARDITAERRMAARLESTMAALEAALADARSSEAAIRQFLDDAAHQLRSPMAGLRACAETLARGCSPAEQEELLAAIAAETARAGRLMTGLLRMTRLNHGHRLAAQPCDLAQLARQEAERVTRMAPHLEVSVVVDPVSPPGPTVLDPQVVAEILANLLDNASRHAMARVEVVVARRGGALNLTVSDDGPGLPAGAEHKAFARFVSLDGLGGSGLGLHIARESARAHGGALDWEGGAFVLRLPGDLEVLDPVPAGAGQPADG